MPVRGLTSGGNSVRIEVSVVGVGEAAGVAVGGMRVGVDVACGVAGVSDLGVRVGVGVTAFPLPLHAEKHS
jgi:hypothetical protein